MNERGKLATLMGSAAHSLIVVANDGLGNQGSEVVVIVPANTLHGQCNVCKAERVVSNADFRADKVGLLFGENVGFIVRRSRRETRKVLLGKLDQLFVRNTTSSNQYHTISGVVSLDVVR